MKEVKKLVSKCCNVEIKKVSSFTAWFFEYFTEIKLVCPKCFNVGKVLIKEIEEGK